MGDATGSKRRIDGTLVSAGPAHMRYDAFISYSHAADGRLAPSLRNGLHRLAKAPFQLRALNVFRDETSLSATPSLWPSIEAALSQSRFFILLASPEAVASRWVVKEVDWWCRNRSVAHLLIALTSGEIVWDQSAGGFDWEQTTALPQRLRGTFAHEPRWIDFRWARTETDVSLRHPVFRQGVADLAAPLHGRPKDEIIGDDVSQQRRAQALRALAVSALFVFAIAVTVAAWIALEQRDAALTDESRTLAMSSREETRNGRTRQAIASALKALPRHVSAPDRPYVPIAEVALANALRALGCGDWEGPACP
ncbi:MAG: TIR domain-containing protein [Chromatiaceae bacterium]